MVLTHQQQQYLCPDYVNPLTSMSLDANKSPLALLAQTCNSIGLPPNSEPSPAPKSAKNLSNGVLSKNNMNPIGGGNGGGGRNSAELSEKMTSSSSSPASSSSSTNKHHNKDNNDTNGKRFKHSGAGAPSSDAASSGADQNGQNSDHRHKDGDHRKSNSTKPEETSATKRAISESIKSEPLSKGVNEPKNSRETNGHSLSPSTSKHAAAPVSQSTGLPPASPSTISQNYANFFSHYFSPSSSSAAAVAAAAFPFSSAAALNSAGILPPMGCYSQQPFLAPGLFQRLCTDPFCKNCPPGAAAAASSLMAPTLPYGANPGARPACPTGCTQCALGPAASMDLATWLNPYSSFFALHGLSSAAAPHPLLLSALSPPGSNGGPLQGVPGSTAANFLNAFCPNPASIPTTMAGNALVCNLFNGDKFCGKIFTNADELAAHFRGHAAQAAAAAAVSGSAPVSASSVGPSTSGHCCQWNNGDKVCGKIFPTADELAQHLRTHSQEVNNGNGANLHSPGGGPVKNGGPSSSSSIPISNNNCQISSSSSAAVHLPSNSSSVLTSAAGNGRLSPRSSSISASYLNSLNALRYHPYKLPGMAGPPNLLPQGAYPSFAALPSNAYNSLQAAAFLGAQKLPATYPQL